MPPMRYSRLILTTAVSLMSFVALADDSKPAGPKSPAATAAIAKLDAANRKASEDYQRAVAAAARQAVQELEAAKQAAMKAGNLTEANAIQAVIDDLSARPVTPKKFVIKAGDAPGWHKTVTVTEGVPIQIATSGTWCADPRRRDQYTFGAEGTRNGMWFGLMGRINDGEPFKIGSAKSITPEASGFLYLRLGGGNDTSTDDGALTVTISSPSP